MFTPVIAPSHASLDLRNASFFEVSVLPSHHGPACCLNQGCRVKSLLQQRSAGITSLPSLNDESSPVQTTSAILRHLTMDGSSDSRGQRMMPTPQHDVPPSIDQHEKNLLQSLDLLVAELSPQAAPPGLQLDGREHHLDESLPVEPSLIDPLDVCGGLVHHREVPLAPEPAPDQAGHLPQRGQSLPDPNASLGASNDALNARGCEAIASHDSLEPPVAESSLNAHCHLMLHLNVAANEMTPSKGLQEQNCFLALGDVVAISSGSMASHSPKGLDFGGCLGL
mmetsp:Transcript_91244/g.199874  ORF Transcript_91244/g.199874 Transcript_91244/m.199874 type:complete len:281 (-) Transcript_91244:220-1062(-)